MSSAVVPDYPPRTPPGAKDLPYDDGEPMETYRHFNQMSVLIESLRYGWHARRDFFVAGNMFMYFSETQARRNDFRGPDVFVVLDTTSEDRLSWVVWEEDGKTPSVVIELLSESTAAIDRGKKKEIYARQLRVPYYYLFHPITFEFEGFELDAASRSYRPLPPLPNGDLPCPVLGLSLGMRLSTYRNATITWLRWIDAEGKVLATGEEMAEAAVSAAEAEKEKAEAEREKAEAAQREADAAQRQAEAALREAQAEKEKAAALAAELEEYRKRFGPV